MTYLTIPLLMSIEAVRFQLSSSRRSKDVAHWWWGHWGLQPHLCQPWVGGGGRREGASEPVHGFIRCHLGLSLADPIVWPFDVVHVGCKYSSLWSPVNPSS